MKIKNSNPHKYRAGVGDDGSGGGGGLSIKKEQAGWRQLGFSIQFSCPEPWQTG